MLPYHPVYILFNEISQIVRYLANCWNINSDNYIIKNICKESCVFLNKQYNETLDNTCKLTLRIKLKLVLNCQSWFEIYLTYKTYGFQKKFLLCDTNSDILLIWPDNLSVYVFIYYSTDTIEPIVEGKKSEKSLAF